MTVSTAAQRASDYAKVLQTLRRDEADVRFCVRCGSHVYGTAGPSSDHDFLVVLADAKAPRDLVWGRNLNVIVHGARTYAAALDDQSVFAHEGLFAPVEHRLKDARPAFPFRIQRGRLFDSAQGRADSDWAKAKGRFDDEPEASKKRVLQAVSCGPKTARARPACRNGPSEACSSAGKCPTGPRHTRCSIRSTECLAKALRKVGDPSGN